MNNNVKNGIEVINQQIKELVGIYRIAVGRSGISENEFWIWYTLTAMNGEYSQQDICALWSLSKQTVNTIISHMVQNEYAVLEVVPGTRNRKIIRLTRAGKSYGKRIVKPMLDAERRTFNRLPEEDINACIDILAKYIGVLKEEIGERK